MSNKKPDPIFQSSQPNVCPICGSASYSAAGIHPQCAVKQADEKRRIHLKKIKSEAAPPKPETAALNSRWQKTCPKCSATQHVRKKKCDCGHTFAVNLRKSRPT
jgi:predicted nucleic-acid-binding Zn-ribbon protein